MSTSASTLSDVKTCRKCLRELPLDAFGRKGDGLQARCRDCVNAYVRAHRRPRAPKPWRHECQRCGDTFLALGRVLFCGDACRARPLQRPPVLVPPDERRERLTQYRDWLRAQEPEAPRAHRFRFVAGTCRVCRAAFVAADWTGTAAYCSPACAKADRRHRRRRAVRGRYLEPVSWRTLYRQGFRLCWLCHGAVDLRDFALVKGADGRLAFVAGPHYPTLDHVRALTEGGQHETANAALAHALCNSTKGTSAVNRPHLVAFRP